MRDPLTPRYACPRVIPDAPICFEERDDTVVVGSEGYVLGEVESLVARMGINQPGLVKAVTSR